MSMMKGGMELPPSGENPMAEEELALFDKVAKKVVEWRMTVPAVVFLESMKPMNFIGAQTMVFFEPIVQTIFNIKDYETFRVALEKRESIEILIRRIEELDAVTVERDKRVKKYLKVQKKTWKWYQRYLGLFLPKVEIPEEIANPPKDSDTAAADAPKQD